MRKLVACMVATLVSLAGCAGGGGTSGAEEHAEGPIGEATFELVLPDGTEVESAVYMVTGGPLGVTRTGTIDVHASERLRFQVGNLPIGSGYVISVTLTSSAGGECTGQTSFAILDTATTSVSLRVECDVIEHSERGNLRVSAEVLDFDAGIVCPAVTGISTLPGEVYSGGSST